MIRRLWRQRWSCNRRSSNWVNAAVAGIADGAQWRRPDLGHFRRGRGDAGEFEPPMPLHINPIPTYFSNAITIAELAVGIIMKCKRVLMPAAALEAAVTR
jgi:hypothetical protein